MSHTASIPVLSIACDLLNIRAQCIVHAPAAQQACQACTSRLPGEDEDDRVHLLESLDRSDQWLFDSQRDGSIVLRWSSAA